MISKFYVQSIGKHFLLLSCFASGMLIGGQNPNKKYSAELLQEEVVSGKKIYQIVVCSRDRKERRSWITLDQPIQNAFWDKKRRNILHIESENGAKFTVNVKDEKNVTIQV